MVEASLCRGPTRVTESKVFAVRQHQRLSRLATTDYSGLWYKKHYKEMLRCAVNGRGSHATCENTHRHTHTNMKAYVTFKHRQHYWSVENGNVEEATINLNDNWKQCNKVIRHNDTQDVAHQTVYLHILVFLNTFSCSVALLQTAAVVASVCRACNEGWHIEEAAVTLSINSEILIPVSYTAAEALRFCCPHNTEHTLTHARLTTHTQSVTM